MGLIRMRVSFVTGGGATSIADDIEKAYAAKQAALTDGERIAADVAISQLSAQQASLIRGGMLSAVIQALWAAPFIVYNFKLVVWDKVWMGGTTATDGLSPSLSNIEMIIVGFYFLQRLLT